MDVSTRYIYIYISFSQRPVPSLAILLSQRGFRIILVLLAGRYVGEAGVTLRQAVQWGTLKQYVLTTLYQSLELYIFGDERISQCNFLCRRTHKDDKAPGWPLMTKCLWYEILWKSFTWFSGLKDHLFWEAFRYSTNSATNQTAHDTLPDAGPTLQHGVPVRQYKLLHWRP